MVICVLYSKWGNPNYKCNPRRRVLHEAVVQRHVEYEETDLNKSDKMYSSLATYIFKIFQLCSLLTSHTLLAFMFIYSL
jgi:hypothetical protein